MGCAESRNVDQESDVPDSNYNLHMTIEFKGNRCMPGGEPVKTVLSAPQAMPPMLNGFLHPQSYTQLITKCNEILTKWKHVNRCLGQVSGVLFLLLIILSQTSGSDSAGFGLVMFLLLTVSAVSFGLLCKYSSHNQSVREELKNYIVSFQAGPMVQFKAYSYWVGSGDSSRLKHVYTIEPQRAGVAVAAMPGVPTMAPGQAPGAVLQPAPVQMHQQQPMHAAPPAYAPTPVAAMGAVQMPPAYAPTPVAATGAVQVQPQMQPSLIQEV